MIGMTLRSKRNGYDGSEMPLAYATIHGRRVGYEDRSLTCNDEDLPEFIRRANEAFERIAAGKA